MELRILRVHAQWLLAVSECTVCGALVNGVVSCVTICDKGPCWHIGLPLTVVRWDLFGCAMSPMQMELS